MKAKIKSIIIILALILRVVVFAADNQISIREEQYVSISGVDQWISIRGGNKENPILLIIHGGPGFSNAAHTHAFDQWEEKFVLVDWDQPGAGRTYYRNGPAAFSELSIDRIAEDGIQLSKYLIEYLENDQLIVLGLSFGTIIGLNMVTKRPDLYSAYVGTGQLVNRAEGDLRGYEKTLAEARRTINEEAIAELEVLGRPPWPNSAMWNSAKGLAGRMTRAEDPSSNIRLNSMMDDLLSNGYSPDEVAAITEGARFTVQQLAPHESLFDARILASRLDVPVYIFQGENDLNTETSLAIEWFNSLDAPDKDIFIVEGGSHGAFYSSAREFGEFLDLKIQH